MATAFYESDVHKEVVSAVNNFKCGDSSKRIFIQGNDTTVTDVTTESGLFAVGNSTFYRKYHCSILVRCCGGKRECFSYRCKFSYQIRDSFEDPLGIGIEIPGCDTYPINASWHTSKTGTTCPDGKAPGILLPGQTQPALPRRRVNAPKMVLFDITKRVNVCRQMSTKSVFILFFGMLFLTVLPFGCKSKIDDLHFSGTISKSDIIGKWLATAESLDQIAEMGYSLKNQKEDHVLLFMDNDRCRIQTFQSIPPFPKAQDFQDLYIENAEGEWQIGDATIYRGHREQLVPAVLIKIRNEPIDPAGNIHINITTLTFFIGKNESNLVLWQYAGDPDSKNYFIYRLEKVEQ